MDETERWGLTRRDLLRGALAILPVMKLRGVGVRGVIAGSVAREDDGVHVAADDFAAIERRVGGRLGVSVLDIGSGKRLAYREDERFAMCSTFKFLAVAAILKRVDAKRDDLDRRVAYDVGDLLDYAPITKQHVTDGAMTLSALCAAAMEYSDNTAANLLLRELGGPAKVTDYARSLGDGMTRLDRTEPTLNTALPGDLRDTTTPKSMVNDLERVLLGSVLSSGSRELLTGWMVANTTGASKLRAGVPGDWRVGDKTGSGQRGASGDIAIMWPNRRKPVLVAAYLMETGARTAEKDGMFRDVGRAVVESAGI